MITITTTLCFRRFSQISVEMACKVQTTQFRPGFIPFAHPIRSRSDVLSLHIDVQTTVQTSPKSANLPCKVTLI